MGIGEICLDSYVLCVKSQDFSFSGLLQTAEKGTLQLCGDLSLHTEQQSEVAYLDFGNFGLFLGNDSKNGHLSVREGVTTTGDASLQIAYGSNLQCKKDLTWQGRGLSVKGALTVQNQIVWNSFSDFSIGSPNGGVLSIGRGFSIIVAYGNRSGSVIRISYTNGPF